VGIGVGVGSCVGVGFTVGVGVGLTVGDALGVALGADDVVLGGAMPGTA
jgi:hypothetical protein